MATAAGVNEDISADAMDAYLDRWLGLDEQAASIMGAAMKECKDGPRKDQKDLKEEMKSNGVRIPAFKALLAVRKAEAKARKVREDLEDDDLAQYRKIAEDYPEDTIFGFMARKALNEPDLD